jgi:hypothetical protein
MPDSIIVTNPSSVGALALQLGLAPGPLACPAGAQTLINSGQVQVDEDGFFLLVPVITVPVKIGAVAPTAIAVITKLLNTDFSSAGYFDGTTLAPPDLLVALSTFILPLVNMPSSTGNLAGFVNGVALRANKPANLAMYLNPTGQAVTVGANGFCSFFLLRMSQFRSTYAISGGVGYVT